MRSQSRFPPWLLLGLAFPVLMMSGCGQLKTLIQTRPSENMPAYHPVEVHYSDQNWTAAQRQWFYHTAQGTELLPYKWFVALEQPQIKIFGGAPVDDQDVVPGSERLIGGW